MNAAVTRLLLAGSYICQYRYPTEYQQLEELQAYEEINDWLGTLNLRLARLSEEGAFFAAPLFIGQSEINTVKNELLKFRDVYGPAVLMLDLLRQADSSNIFLRPGEFIHLYQLEDALTASNLLQTQLKGILAVISNASMRSTNYENLRRLMEHLVKDEYLHLVAKDTGGYQVTGKIEQLYAALRFLDENKVIPDEEVDDLEDLDAEGDLFGELSSEPSEEMGDE